MLVAPLPAGAGVGAAGGSVAGFMSSVEDGAFGDGAVGVFVVFGGVVVVPAGAPVSVAFGVVVVVVPPGVVVVVVLPGVPDVSVAFGLVVVVVVPGATPGVPGSYVAGGGELGSAPLGIVCAPLDSGFGLGSAFAVEMARAKTPGTTIAESTFMAPSPPLLQTLTWFFCPRSWSSPRPGQERVFRSNRARPLPRKGAFQHFSAG
jgi:hypothetical protein